MNADIATLRQQLRQLQSLHADGALSAQAYERSRGGLERRLLDAVMACEPAAAQAETGRPRRADAGGPAGRLRAQNRELQGSRVD